jgi:hypothetical protein
MRYNQLQYSKYLSTTLNSYLFKQVTLVYGLAQLFLVEHLFLDFEHIM